MVSTSAVRSARFGLTCLVMTAAVAFSQASSSWAQGEEAKPADADVARGSAEPEGTFDFTGTRWRVTGVGGKDVSMAGDLHFETDLVDGASACNFFGGAFELGDGDGLQIKVNRMTRRGCSGDALELERSYLEALAAVRGYRFLDEANEKLSLLDAEGNAVAQLERKHGFQLEGTPLKVVSYLFEDGLYSVKPGSKVTIRFAGGRMEGDTGCSLFSGHYEIAEATLKITLDMAVPKSEKCSDDLRRQDQAIIADLEKAARFDVGRNVIRLLQADRDWAVLWLAHDTDPEVPAGEAKPLDASKDPGANATAASKSASPDEKAGDEAGDGPGKP